MLSRTKAEAGAQDAKMVHFETFAWNPLLQQGWR
jgi:hypothetical protein